MKILMLGNSFTYFHDMPRLLQAMSGAEVTAHTRGGAYLTEHLSPETEMGRLTLPALRETKWDYVVLQDQSSNPALHPDAFLKSAEALCAMIRAAGATPVMYATWAYREGSEKLQSVQMTFDDMQQRLTSAYAQAAQRCGALLARVGDVFNEARSIVNVYESDDFHPSEAGSALAAAVILRTIEADARAKEAQG